MSSRNLNQLKQVERSWNLNPVQESIDPTTVFPLQDLYRSSQYIFQTYYSPPSFKAEETPIVFIAHHGAGSCGLTFGMLKSSIKTQAVKLGYNSIPGLLTFDIRGHSKSNCLNGVEENYNMSLDQLTLDFLFILNHFIQSKFPNSPIDVYLIGHSLGGSVLTNLVHNKMDLIERPEVIKGLVIIDIVEETAIKSLSSMQSYLNHLPREFNSIDDCVNWHLNSNLLNNKVSAKLTIPELLHKTESGKFKWVCDLRRTSKYWNGWFTNLSQNFISIPNKVSKLLILANNDYLDKSLMIGQMQGKYQLVVFHNNLNIQSSTRTTLNDSNNVGHFIHQDIPDKMAICLLEYVERGNTHFFNLENKDQNELLMSLNKKWGVQ